jgi:hypothetical protein
MGKVTSRVTQVTQCYLSTSRKHSLGLYVDNRDCVTCVTLRVPVCGRHTGGDAA